MTEWNIIVDKVVSDTFVSIKTSDVFHIENINWLQNWIRLQICEDVQDIPKSVTTMQYAWIQGTLSHVYVTKDSLEMGRLAQVCTISLYQGFCLN